MVIIHLDERDLARIRFAYNPLTELTLSYKMLKQAPAKPFDRMRHNAWVEDARLALDGVQLPYMDALITLCCFVPDFIVPPVGGVGLRLEDQLKDLSNVPAHLIVQDVVEVVKYEGMNDEREQFIHDPHETIPCLVEELWFYWNRVLAPFWPRMAATLDSDLNYRARQLALHGIEAVLSDLNERLKRPDQETLVLEKPQHYPATALDGRGLQLQPTLFDPLLWQTDLDWPPFITYGARGFGVWYQPPEVETDEAIVLAVGASKARLLLALKEPQTTTDLAHLLHLSAGAVSQQLSRLSKAGLVVSSRMSNRVYYRLSPRGTQLLDVFA